MEEVKLKQETLYKSPLLCLGIIFDNYGVYNEKYRLKQDEAILILERETGMSSLSFGSHGVGSMHYERLIKDVHDCNTRLIFLENMMNFEEALGKFVRELLSRVEKIHIQYPDLSCHEAEWQKIMEYVDFYLSRTIFNRSQGLSLQKRVQSQISVVRDSITLNLTPD